MKLGLGFQYTKYVKIGLFLVVLGFFTPLLLYPFSEPTDEETFKAVLFAQKGVLYESPLPKREIVLYKSNADKKFIPYKLILFIGTLCMMFGASLVIFTVMKKNGVNKQTIEIEPEKISDPLKLTGKIISKVVYPNELNFMVFPVHIEFEDNSATTLYTRNITEEKKYELKSLFHKIWTNDLVNHNYDKKDWNNLRNLLHEFGVTV